jgi:hypothetical protein
VSRRLEGISIDLKGAAYDFKLVADQGQAVAAPYNSGFDLQNSKARIDNEQVIFNRSKSHNFRTCEPLVLIRPKSPFRLTNINTYCHRRKQASQPPIVNPPNSLVCANFIVKNHQDP